MQVFIGLAILAAYVIVFGLIFRKMGYSTATGLLAIIPIVNLLWLLHLATSDWPIWLAVTSGQRKTTWL